MKPGVVHVAAFVALCGCSANAVPSYVARYQEKVHISDHRDYIPQEKVDSWTISALAFWLLRIPQWRWCLSNWRKFQHDLKVNFSAECPVGCRSGENGESVDAYACIKPARGKGGHVSYEIEIGDCGIDYEAYMHEMSHLIFMTCSDLSGDEAHKMFEFFGLPGA